MNLLLDCPTCGKRLEIGEAHFGRRVLCGGCNEAVNVPRVEAASPAPEEAGASIRHEPPPDDWRDAAPAASHPSPLPPAWAEAAARSIRRTPTQRPWIAVVLPLLLCCAGVLAFGVWFGFAAMERSNEDVAKAQIIGTLIPAVERYKGDQEINPAGEPPENLKDLLDSDKAAVQADQLIDPWGQPYRYSPESSHDAPEGFDIWTRTPSQKVIGNWKR